MNKYKFLTDIEDFSIHASCTENYTGAEIELIIRKAYEIANELSSNNVHNIKITFRYFKRSNSKMQT